MACHSTLGAPAILRTGAAQRDDHSCRGASVPLVAKASSSTQSHKLALPKTFFSGETHILSRGNQVSFAQRATLKVDCGESRIGKQPVEIPKGVTYTLNGQHLSVKGSLGTMEQTFPNVIAITEEDGKLRFAKTEETKTAKQLHGLSRSLAYNMVNGVATGWEKKLELVGVGYRCSMQGTNLQLNLGFSHPVIMTPPEGIKVEVEGNTNLKISGYDKAVVGNFAATIRRLRPPEPYKGKGVKYADETILRKEGKSGKK